MNPIRIPLNFGMFIEMTSSKNALYSDPGETAKPND